MNICKNCGARVFSLYADHLFCSSACHEEWQKSQDVPGPYEEMPQTVVRAGVPTRPRMLVHDGVPYEEIPPPPPPSAPERTFDLDALRAAAKPPSDYVLPADSEERKQIPIFSGVLNYFPLAIAAVARVSKRGNDKHNPGEALHWARGKSMDHCDCIARHLIDVETVSPDTGEYEDAQALAWRALAKLQELEEARLNKAPSRGSR